MKLIKLLAAAVLPFAVAIAPSFAQSSSGVVISQFAVRGPAGGNDEFVEINNAGAASVAIGGWTLQGCANGSPGTASVRATVPAGTVLLPGRYYLFANTAASGYSLGVAPDTTYATGFTDFTAAGFSGLRIVSSSSVVTGAGTAVDAVGGNASPCHEGTGLVTPTANGVNTAYLRRTVGGAFQDANDNSIDFPAVGPGTPHNSASPANGGGGGVNQPSVSLSVSPTSFAEAGGSAVITATLSGAYTAPVTVNLTFGGAATNGTDYTPSASSITIATGDTYGSITLTAIDDSTFEGNESVIASLGSLTNAVAGTPNSVTATIIDDDPAPPPVIGARIYQIQGNRHISPMAGQGVTNVPGIVTVVDSNGFYMQDGDGDGDVNTSDGILVFTSTAPTVTVGQQVLVSGTVSEFRPNGATGLSVTEITAPTITPSANLFTNNTIVPTIIGIGGRTPPTDIIDNDSNGNVETSPTSIFDPSEDGIDFYETLEGMLVQINNPVLTSPTLASSASGDRQYFVLGDNGTAATGRNARGGVTLVERSSGVDYNPERIELFTGLPNTNAPAGTIFNVGDKLAGPIVGVMSYFGNYEVLPTAAPVVATPANNAPTVTTAVQKGGDRLSVATFNIENYDPSDPVARRNKLAFEIVNNLQSPDIISLGEVQDNNGAASGGVAADVTIQTIIDAIVAAGGPTYSYQQINPATGNPDGGEPNGNIRIVQLYNPLRVSFVAGTVGVGGSLDATAVQLVNGKLVLTLSPGRLSPTDPAWNSSRKPLAVTYDFNGRRVLVIGNHLNSKGGDQSLYGVNQPPVLSSETQRRQQTQIIHDFVYGALALDPNARIVVLGDLNDFDFSNPLRILRDGALGPNGEEGTQPALINLGTALVPDPAERYSYVFDGNSQELDHILASPYLFNTSSPQYQVAHTNSEYGDQASDHDPIVSSYLIPANVAPTAVAVATPSTVNSGATVALDGTGSSDSDGSIASYSWTQTAGPSVSITGAGTGSASFVAPSVSSATVLTLQLTVTDNEGLTGSSSVSVTVNPPVNTTPTPFSFSPVSNVALNTLVMSDSIVVLGINAPAAITVTGGEYSINGNPFTSLVGGVVNNNDLVRVRVLSSSQFQTSTTAVLTIDTVSAPFTVTTVAIDTTPDSFSFQPATGVLRNSVQTSAAITVSGINNPAPISVTGGSYSINGGPFVTTAGTVSNGASVTVRQTASRKFNTTTTATLTIGGVSGSYSVTTRRLFQFGNGLNAEPDVELAPGLVDRMPLLQREEHEARGAGIRRLAVLTSRSPETGSGFFVLRTGWKGCTALTQEDVGSATDSPTPQERPLYFQLGVVSYDVRHLGL